MRPIRNICVIVLVVLPGAAGAEDLAWRTVDLDGGVRIDVPAQLADRIKPPVSSPGLLMSFALDAGDPGTIACQLQRMPYGPGMPRAALAAQLTKGDVGNFCKAAGSAIQGWQLGSAEKYSTDGLPSGHCLSAYSDTSQQQAGKVMTVKMVAGMKSSYRLTCVSSFDDRDGAVTAYATRWNDIVNHLQQSLHPLEK